MVFIKVIILLVCLTIILAFLLFGVTFIIMGMFGKDLTQIIDAIWKRNVLLNCESCGRYQRRYQIQFANIITGKTKYRVFYSYEFDCVHCGSYQYSRNEQKERSWTPHHVDCPTISIIQYLESFLAMKKAEKARKDIEEVKEFEKYNNLGNSENWIKKLQKELDKL